VTEQCSAVNIKPVPADATAEKNTRAAFKAEVDRRLSRKMLVILDTLNNIKGFRWVHVPYAC
jgi:tRNA uridine 5-carbamoylmethylation protein Kti12